jgi:hypothetical protein
MAQHDYTTNLKSKEEIDLLMDINCQQLEILRELQQLRTLPASVAGTHR